MPEKLSSLSLKSKIVGTVLLLFIASFWLLTYVVEKRLARDMATLLETQQFSTVSYIASDLDDKIRQRIQLLNSDASIITPEILANPAKAREFLKTRFGLLALFKAGIVLVSGEGAGIADYPPVPNRASGSFCEQDYFKEVVASGKAAISRPRVGRFSKKPGVAMAAPVKDGSGRIIGLLVGFAAFSDPTFFGQVEHANVGRSGHIAILVPRHNLIATSSNRALVLQPMEKPGAKRVLERFLAGYEGSGTEVDPQGVETLSSAKRIPAAGWIAQIVLPTDEALAPIRTMRIRAYTVAATLSLFALFALWLVIRRLLEPLSLASRSVGEMLTGDLQPIPVKHHDEIGKLLKNFNLLVAERSQAEEALRQSEERFRIILENAPIGMSVESLEGRFVLVNRSLCEILGYEQEELERMTFQDITHPDDREFNLAEMQRLLEGSVNSYRMDKRFLRKDHQDVWAQLTLSVVRDSAKAPLYLIAQIEDITERKRNLERIHQLAYYDALTDLPNRRLLQDRLNQAMVQARRYQRSLALMFLDLDNFKQVNDTLGHDFGDELLKVVAGRLLTSLRTMDTVCRQGGDEFIVVLSEIHNQHDATIVADKIIKAINEPVTIGENELHVTTSIGIALYPVNGDDDATELMKKADMAMYEAKKKGRNGYSVYRPAI